MTKVRFVAITIAQRGAEFCFLKYFRQLQQLRVRHCKARTPCWLLQGQCCAVYYKLWAVCYTDIYDAVYFIYTCLIKHSRFISISSRTSYLLPSGSTCDLTKWYTFQWTYDIYKIVHSVQQQMSMSHTHKNYNVPGPGIPSSIL